MATSSLPFKQRSGDYFAPPKPLPLYGNAYPTRIAETGQSIWIRLDGPRSPEHGYREISVSDEPLRTDAAIVAALSALEGRTFDLATLRSVLALSMPLRGESFWDRWTKALEDRRTEEGMRSSLRELEHHQALDFVMMLLRYHRPSFDELPTEEQTNIVADACAHINEFLEALRRLLTSLKAALGEDGWKEHVRAMKEEAETWRSRSPLQRQAELEAEALGVPYEEVLRRLEEELRRSSEESNHGIREGVAY